MRCPGCGVVVLALVVVSVSSCGSPECTQFNDRYDEGATLSRDGWILARSCDAPPYVFLTDMSNRKSLANYSIGLTSEAATISLRPDGLLAIATRSGLLALTQLTAPPPLTTDAYGYTYAPSVELWPSVVSQLHAAAAAWSNDGQRLAVVAWAANGSLKLQVFNAALDVLSEHAIELQQAADGYTPCCVSWSADDARVAISTNIFDTKLVDPECLLLDLSRGDTQRLALANVYFVGDDVLVGTELTVARADEWPCSECDLGPVYRIQMAGGEIASRTELPGAIRAAASYALFHTFATADRVRCTFEGEFGWLPSVDFRLRDADGQFSILVTAAYGSSSCPAALVPNEGVEQWGAAAP
jgi:hypothetical protein